MPRIVSRLLTGALTLAAVAFVGCDGLVFLFTPLPDAPPEAPAMPRADTGALFEPSRTGAIAGQVLWDGPAPRVLPYRARLSPHVQRAGTPTGDRFNPLVPSLGPGGQGVAGAVVFLRGLDPRKGRPWDLPPVRVEQRGYRLHIRQGASVARVGFVRRGDPVEFTAAADDFHVLRARGADFFTLPFPRLPGGEPARPCVRHLQKPGVVELSSAAGYFWMRGHLFVADHPYYTLTDQQGRFSLDRVPPGEYEVVCWMPNWHEDRRELDAETAGITHLYFRSPVEVARNVEVAEGQTATPRFTFSVADFGPPAAPGKW